MGELKTIDNNGQADETAVQYIVVKIGSEQYGIDIKYIDNIVKNQRITRVPKTQKYYNGVINLRGEIIPVMSIRVRLGLEPDTFTDKTRIIIIKLENAMIGIIVDQVNEVITLNQSDVEIPHEKGEVANGYICGIGKYKGELVSLLDIVDVIVEKEN